MAHLRKKSFTKPIPPDAEIVTAKGVRCARFKATNGKTVTVPLTENGKRIRLESRKWYGFYTDGDGKPQAIPLFSDKVASQQRLAEILRNEELKQAGIVDPFAEHRVRPLTEHLDDYRRLLEADGNCAEYVSKTVARITAILDGCDFKVVADLDDDKVAEFLHGLRRDPPRPVLPVGKEWFTPAELGEALGNSKPGKLSRVIKREGLSVEGNGPARRYPKTTVERLQDIYCRGIGISTSNGYATAVKGFSRWLFEKGRMDKDRFASLSRLNADTDRRHNRRALEEPQLNGLLSSAWTSPRTFEGLTGRDRAMIYMLGMTTGFRASEMASLTPVAFDLSATGSSVNVRAAYTKNKKQAEQPLPPDVAAAFQDCLRDRPATDALWPGSWNENAAEMLRIDLEAAGIPYCDADGKVADFHSLRHGYISLLSHAGVHPKVAQELARHSDIRLTMQVYTHARLHDLSSAVDNLPIIPPGGTRPQSVPLAMTGTDSNLPVKSLLPACLPASFLGEKACDNMRTPETNEQESGSEAES